MSFQDWRGVARGVRGGGRAPSEFGRPVNPIRTRGAEFAPHTTASPPGFKNLSTPLKSIVLQLNLLQGFPYFIFYAPALALVDIKKVVMLKREKMKL